MPAAHPEPDRLLEPLRDEPSASAVLSDVDGTLAPIVDDPGAAAVLPAGRDALAELAASFALVACVSGRPAAEARRIVGLDGVTYLGNHGLERLDPGAPAARASTALAGHEGDAAAFLARIAAGRIAAAGLRTEDKGAIRALHWRGAEDEDGAAAEAAAIAAEAEAAGLAVHHGRKVLELRPPVPFDKGSAIAELLGDRPIRHALYAGDDRTDVDGFRALRDRAASGGLETAVCVAIGSSESPPEVTAEADLVVAGPAEFAALLGRLARA
ncbi:MAG TPA: trehalose-phosphatase [Solirubrobacterales bacterium]